MTNTLDGLLSSLGRASWQGALVFLFVWLFCRVLARRLTADAHCWLWRLGYVKLLVGLLWGGVVLLPLLSPAPSAVVAQSRLTPIAYPRPAGPSEAGAVLPASVGPVAGPRLGWHAGLATVYAFGVAVCLGRLLLATRRTRRVLRLASPNVPALETACAAGLARAMGLRHVPTLARSAEVDSPVLIAGRVLLPSEAQYGEDALRMILAHELAHARRRDLLWEWLGTVVQVVFFFHPLVVLARREERLAREAAADALALRTTGAGAADYGGLLLSLSLGQAGPRPALIGAVGVIEGGSPLRRRLLALRDGAAHANTRRTRWRLALTLVPLMALVFVPWRMTHGQATTPAPAPTAAAPAFPKMPHGDKGIVGTVRDEMGKPVAGLTVSLTWHWSQSQKTGEHLSGSIPVGRVSTDAQGRFAFSGLPAGVFDYDVFSPTNQYVPVQTPLVISKDDTQKARRVIVSPGALVTGRVVDGQTGKPMAGVFVGAGSIPPGGDLAKWDFWAMPSEAATDAGGHYQVRVTPGEVFVGVGRISNSTLFSRRIRYTAQRVSVRPGQTAPAPDIRVSLNPVIVCVGPDGQPVADTTVRLTPTDMAKGEYILDDHTDNTGAVVLSRFQSGTFSLSRNSLYASGTFQWSPDQSLVIETNGQAVNFPNGVGAVQLTAGSSAAITGRVVSEAGGPVPNALVTVFETDPKSHYGLGRQAFRADAAGVFRAPLDPNGQFHAYVRADGFNQISVSDQPLALAKGRALDLGPVRLTRADGAVSGRIVDTSGRPMLGVVASVQGQKTGISAALTDAQGRFRIPNVVLDEALRLTLCLKGEVHDSGEALYQSNEQMDFSGVQASPTEREIVWRPHSGGY